MTLLMSFVTAEKKKPKRIKTKHEMKTSAKKIRAKGKTRQKKGNLNTELFVMLNLRSW